MVCDTFEWFVAVRQGGGPGGRGGKFAKGGKEGPDACEEHLPPHGLIALTPLVDVEAGGGVTEFFTASHATVDGPAPQAGGGAPAQGRQSAHCQRPASTGPANDFFKQLPSIDGAHDWLGGLGRQLRGQCAAAKRWPGGMILVMQLHGWPHHTVGPYGAHVRGAGACDANWPAAHHELYGVSLNLADIGNYWMSHVHDPRQVAAPFPVLTTRPLFHAPE